MAGLTYPAVCEVDRGNWLWSLLLSNLFTAKSFCFRFRRAEVVELVDALRSGRSEGNLVGVRIPPSAPIEFKTKVVSPSVQSDAWAEGFFMRGTA